MRERDHQQGVAVGLGLGDHLRRNDASGPAAVLDDHLLAELLTELGGDQAPDDVVAAAGRERDDQPHGLRRIILCGDGGG